jgi:hypothetical protein
MMRPRALGAVVCTKRMLALKRSPIEAVKLRALQVRQPTGPYEIFITVEPETRSGGWRFEWKSPGSRPSRRAEEKIPRLHKGTYTGITVVSDRIQ